MTITALLSRFARNTPRFVTMNGLIIGDAVGTNGGHYSHPVHGSVARVEPHHFHGGDDPEVPAVRPWWLEDPERLTTEEAAMARYFPTFTRYDIDDEPGWLGTIDSGRGRFTIYVAHRADHSLPAVLCVSRNRLGRQRGRRWFTSPHLYRSGRLCVAAESDWDPAVHDATTVVAWAAHWFAAYTEWWITGRWPEEEIRADAA